MKLVQGLRMQSSTPPSDLLSRIDEQNVCIISSIRIGKEKNETNNNKNEARKESTRKRRRSLRSSGRK
jgi:hypothetical protein